METLDKDAIVVIHNLKLLVDNEFQLGWERGYYELTLRKPKVSFFNTSLHGMLQQADKYFTDNKPKPEHVWINKKTGAAVFEEPKDVDNYLKFYAASESAEMVRADRDSH